MVLTIEPHQLLDIKTLSTLLSVVEPYQSWFILSCELDQQPSAEVMTLLGPYRVSFQSDTQYDLSLNNKQAMGKYLYYSHLPVFSMQGSGDDRQMRANIEKIAEINARIILICKGAESEALHKIRVIAEILGY